MKEKSITLIKNKLIVGLYITANNGGFDFKILPTLSLAKDIEDAKIGYAFGLSWGLWGIAIAYLLTHQ